MFGTKGSILREEEHQNRDVIYISCGKGCNSSERTFDKPTHDGAVRGIKRYSNPKSFLKILYELRINY